MIEVDLLRQTSPSIATPARASSDEDAGYTQQTIIDIPVIRHLGEPLQLQLQHFVDLIRGDADPKLRSMAYSPRTRHCTDWLRRRRLRMTESQPEARERGECDTSPRGTSPTNAPVRRPPTPAGTLLSRLLAVRETRFAWPIVYGGVFVAQAMVLLVAGRHQWYFFDEWRLIVERVVQPGDVTYLREAVSPRRRACHRVTAGAASSFWRRSVGSIRTGRSSLRTWLSASQRSGSPTTSSGVSMGAELLGSWCWSASRSSERGSSRFSGRASSSRA